MVFLLSYTVCFLLVGWLYCSQFCFGVLVLTWSGGWFGYLIPVWCCHGQFCWRVTDLSLPFGSPLPCWWVICVIGSFIMLIMVCRSCVVVCLAVTGLANLE